MFVYSIASFITLRCYEQIKIDLCVMKLPVTIIGVGTGFAYDVDGPTHHATERHCDNACGWRICKFYVPLIRI